MFLKGKFKEHSRERLGTIPKTILENLRLKTVIWVHAVSVGEVRLACNMLEDLKNQNPSCTFLLTLNTASSRAMAEKILTKSCYNIMYFPMDFSWIMRRFIKQLNPKTCIVVETEIWPNMIDSLCRLGCPIVLVNGRISDKAFRSYKKIAPFIRPYVRLIDTILVQNETFKKRFLDLGAVAERISVTGNMKYDLQMPEHDHQIESIRKKFDKNSIHVMLASTHDPEESLILEQLKDLLMAKKVVLWVAPRHLNRIEDVWKISESYRLSIRKLSDCKDSTELLRTDVLVVDEWGILNKCYPFMDCVVMGGSFTNVGGHNIGEPAVCGKMIFHGPHMENFEDMRRLFAQQNACLEVADVYQLRKQLENFIQNREPYHLIANRARVVMRSSMGATKRNIKVIQNVFTKK